jgi:hypothetical protein
MSMAKKMSLSIKHENKIIFSIFLTMKATILDKQGMNDLISLELFDD